MSSSDKTRFLLLYGSQTGQAQGIAEEIADRATAQGLTAELHCLSLTEKRFCLERETCCVIVISTTGDGEPPDTVLKFMRRIRKKTLPGDFKAHLCYTLLGLGDSNYTNFCKCGKTLDSRLQELGAKHFYPAGWADDATGLEVVVDPWIEGLWAPLKLQLNPQSHDVPPSPCDISEQNGIEATDKTRVDPDMGKIPTNNTNSSGTTTNVEIIVENKDQSDGDNLHSTPQTDSKEPDKSVTTLPNDNCINGSIDDTMVTGSLLQSRPPLSLVDLSLPVCPARYISIAYHKDETLNHDSVVPQNGFPFPSARADVSEASIVSASRMTRHDAVKTALKLELDISDCDWTYQPGDSIGILCENSAEEVNRLLERLGISTEQADTTCSFSILPATKKRTPAVPKFLSSRATLRHTLMTCCEIRNVPKKGFLRALVEFCDDPLQRRRLQELCSKQGMEDYAEHIRGPSLCLYDVLMAFPSCSPPIEVVLEHLPRLQARCFSAASSPLATPGRFSFVFNIVEFPQCNGRSEARQGVCTSWLNKLTSFLQAVTRDPDDLIGQMSQVKLDDPIKIGIYPRSNLHFRPPVDLSTPLIMIGPGTGVAPFVGFLTHRQMLISDDRKVGDTWLFFGCRHADRDFLYRSELEALQASGALSRLVVSFSRDVASKPGDPRYVQDSLSTHGAEVANLLERDGAILFVCGDAKHMAKDVNEAVVNLLQKHTDMEKNEAEEYVMQLRRDKRYIEDVWT